MMKIKTFSLLLFVAFAFAHISYAGEKFTKISATGEELPDTASEWSGVKNNITGQIWEVKKISNMSNLYNFSNAWDYKRQINQTGLCGYTDWRVPTVKELNSILDRSCTNPSIDTEYFPHTQSTHPMSSTPGYWTSTPKIDTRPYILESWGVNFDFGVTMNYARDFFLFVRLVRGDKYYDFFDYSKLDASGSLLAANNSNHSCVQDNHSGLIWEVKTLANMDNEYTFDEIPAYIQQINQDNFCGHSDWRLPTVDELITLVDYSASSPSIKTEYFPNNNSKGYWASSSNSSDNHDSWAVYTGGAAMRTLESFNFNVRLVRTAQPECIVKVDGDVAPFGSRDGKVNVGDALVALRFALALETPTQEDVAHGDVAPLDAQGKPNPDGTITVGDALVILRNALQIISF